MTSLKLLRQIQIFMLNNCMSISGRFNSEITSSLFERDLDWLGLLVLKNLRHYSMEHVRDVSDYLKNENLRVCIDFRDLNNATPKDEYFMTIVDMLIDSTAENEILSFMDGYLGYNQIFITENDVSKTAFHCPGALGTYEWVVMPFGLKNAGATYQRAMNAIFHEYIGKFMEVYIDDVMVKSISVNQHIDHLRKAFVTMRKKGSKINPLKCAFGVSAGNFLGFVVHKKGIAIDKSKDDAILALSSPKSKKEVQSFMGKFEWTNEHQQAFDSIKAYLSKAPIMANIRPHEPLKLYIATSANIIGCMLAQDDEHGHERCYMVAKSVKVVAQTDLVKYMLSFLMLRGWLGKWMLALTEFDLQYVLAKAVKVPADEREALCIGEWEDNDWRNPIAEYFKNPNIPVDKKVKLRAINFVLMADELYKKGIDGSLSRCLSQGDKDIALGEVHKGICGAHQAGKKMKWVLYRNHVYWPTMIKDFDDYWNVMFDELNELDSERVLALENMIRQKESVARNYNRRIKEKYFSIGELVLKVILPMEKKLKVLGKWSHTWEGPFQVIGLYSGNAYRIRKYNQFD
ncbi:uncharacterized protein [Arachis hypogaea]|uniref:uncharacterized protein n=1 Tax=Arachis hypogaea TaxID=3818 RepID=UPI000DEC2514|nr:uncharacterized protein LOC112721895 [Arachis hypogaea]